MCLLFIMCGGLLLAGQGRRRRGESERGGVGDSSECSRVDACVLSQGWGLLVAHLKSPTNHTCCVFCAAVCSFPFVSLSALLLSNHHCTASLDDVIRTLGCCCCCCCCLAAKPWLDANSAGSPAWQGYCECELVLASIAGATAACIVSPTWKTRARDRRAGDRDLDGLLRRLRARLGLSSKVLESLLLRE